MSVTGSSLSRETQGTRLRVGGYRVTWQQPAAPGAREVTFVEADRVGAMVMVSGGGSFLNPPRRWIERLVATPEEGRLRPLPQPRPLH